MSITQPQDPPTSTKRWLVLVIACMAQFMVVLDATVVNVALPAIQHGLGFSASSLQWVVNAYTLVFGGFLLLGGRAADLLGRKRLFIAGVALFSFASLLNGLAQTSGMLIAGRALQGLGGALVSPAALSIVTTTFTETAERTRALGVWSAIAAGGGAVGLLLGGVLTDLASWPWIFIVNVPGRVDHAGDGARASCRSPGRARPPLVRSGRRGDRDRRPGRARLRDRQGPGVRLGFGRTFGLLAAGVALLALFVAIERAQRRPADAAEHPPRPHPGRGRRRAPARGLGHVRDVLLRLAVRAGDPRLQPAAGGARVPARDRRDRGRSRHRPAAHPPHRRPQRRRSAESAWPPWACSCSRSCRSTAAMWATCCPGCCR